MVFAEGSKCITEVSSGESIKFLSQEDKDKAEASQVSGHNEGNSDGVDQSKDNVQHSMDLRLLLCCTDILLVYSLKSVMQVFFSDAYFQFNFVSFTSSFFLTPFL